MLFGVNMFVTSEKQTVNIFNNARSRKSDFERKSNFMAYLIAIHCIIKVVEISCQIGHSRCSK